MLKLLMPLSAAVLLLAACSNNQHCHDEKAVGQTAPAANDGKHFGAMISADGAMPFDEFLGKMQGDSMPAKIVKAPPTRVSS